MGGQGARITVCGLLANAFDIDHEGDFIAHGGGAVVHAKVAAFEGEAGGAAHTITAPGIRSSADEVHLGGEGFGNTEQGDVSGEFVGIVIDFLHAGSFVGDLGEDVGVEVVGIAQVGITVGKVGVHAGGFDGEVEGGFLGFGGVPFDVTGKFVESTSGLAVAEVGDGKKNGAVGGIDEVGAGGISRGCRGGGGLRGGLFALGRGEAEGGGKEAKGEDEGEGFFHGRECS